MKINRKHYIRIFPNLGLTPSLQLKNCLSKLKTKLQFLGLEIDHVLKQSIFIRAVDNDDYYHKKNEFENIVKDFYKSFIPATSYIGQPPEDNKHVALEVIILIDPAENVEIKRKNVSDSIYTVVNYSEYKEVYAAGLSNGNKLAGTASQADTAFKLMSAILKKENLSFSDVVRQWNYIENIIGVTSDQDNLKQNYQLFNDIRSTYYQTADFVTGYPAATGIGMITGGIILDFIAVNVSNPALVVPIKNPRQVDAHRYTEDVLVGNSEKKDCRKSSPKFERAKTVSFHNSNQIFISGTAAILGQNTITENEVAQQTITTIQNIEKLISTNNLKDCGVQINNYIASLSYARVYVKSEADIPEVKSICEKYFVDVPVLYLVSDICRDDLLVEIEAVAEF